MYVSQISRISATELPLSWQTHTRVCRQACFILEPNESNAHLFTCGWELIISLENICTALSASRLASGSCRSVVWCVLCYIYYLRVPILCVLALLPPPIVHASLPQIPVQWQGTCMYQFVAMVHHLNDCDISSNLTKSQAVSILRAIHQFMVVEQLK